MLGLPRFRDASAVGPRRSNCLNSRLAWRADNPNSSPAFTLVSRFSCTRPSRSNGTENRCFGRIGQGTQSARVVLTIKPSGLDALAFEVGVGRPF